jgi:hypothetical protein
MVSEQKRPTKEQVRQYLNERKAEHSPPPAREEIRQRLGWATADHERPPGGQHVCRAEPAAHQFSPTTSGNATHQTCRACNAVGLAMARNLQRNACP